MRRKSFFIPVLFALLVTGLLGIAEKYHWLSAHAGIRTGLPDAVSEYRKIVQHYLAADLSLHMEGVIRLYDGEKPNELREENPFRYIRNGRQYYMQLSYLQTFCNGTMALQLDTVNKFIVVSGVGDSAKLAGSPSAPLDLLFSDTARFRITGEVSERNNERLLLIKSDLNPEIRSCSILYDPFTYRVNGAEIEWWKEAATRDDGADRVWVTKISYRYLPFEGLQTDALISRIISVGGGRPVGKGRYKGYKINGDNMHNDLNF